MAVVENRVGSDVSRSPGRVVLGCRWRRSAQPNVDLATENVTELRWFSAAALAEANTVFSPRDLGPRLAQVLADGVPPQVIELPPTS